MKKIISITLIALTSITLFLLSGCINRLPFTTPVVKATMDISQFTPLTPNTLVPEDGQIVFSAQLAYENSEIFVVNADGSDLVRLTYLEGFETDPVWSPDGSKIAFVSTRTGTWDICIMDADGSNIVNVTDSPSIDSLPSWSPDGQRLVFQSDRDTQNLIYGDSRDDYDVPQLYIIDIDGSNVKRLTQDPYSFDWDPVWSPDGMYIAFTSQKNFDTKKIEIIEPDGNNRHVLVSDNDNDYVQPAWSPDGKQIAFTKYRIDTGDLTTNLFIMDADGSNIHPISQLQTPGHSAAWSPSGKYIAFDSSDYGKTKFAIYAIDVEGKGVSLLVDIPYSSRFMSWNIK